MTNENRVGDKRREWRAEIASLAFVFINTVRVWPSEPRHKLYEQEENEEALPIVGCWWRPWTYLGCAHLVTYFAERHANPQKAQVA